MELIRFTLVACISARLLQHQGHKALRTRRWTSVAEAAFHHVSSVMFPFAMLPEPFLPLQGVGHNVYQDLILVAPIGSCPQLVR